MIGAATGAIVGDQMDNGEAVPQAVRRCRTVQDRETMPEGYAVVYRYNRRTFSALMPYRPGNTIRVPMSREMDYVYPRDLRHHRDGDRHRGGNRQGSRW
jgi:uncharacterized protein YcfJ